jgi:hypothetical protein
MWTNVLLLRAVLTLYDGTLDVKQLQERYSGLIDEVAALDTPTPPGFEP